MPVLIAGAMPVCTTRRTSMPSGVPAGIDARLVLETGIQPAINTGIAHRKPGIGQVGAGVARAPLACFEQALAALAATLGAN